MNPSRRLLQSRVPKARGQRGAALLTAMIIVTLVTTLAGSMLWQQWRAVQVEAAERARSQAAWMLNGALDWARLILKEAAKSGGGSVTSLDQPWATPFEEARLSTFLAVDSAHTDDAPEAFLSGSIVDAQSRYNLTNLSRDGKVVEAEQQVLERLCQNLGLAADVAARIAVALNDARAGAANAPLLPATVGQLGWLWIDAETVRQLAPYVALLPEPTPLNINTAPREVLAAVIKGLDLGSAERLVQTRQRKPFANLAAVEQLLPTLGKPDPKQLGTTSNYFEVRGRLRLLDRVLEELSLVQRKGARDAVVLQRERVSSHQPGGA
ncbi:MAG: type II secretion system minor pseudopilin GspK [Burkholderiaceae bacterium]